MKILATRRLISPAIDPLTRCPLYPISLLRVVIRSVPVWLKVGFPHITGSRWHSDTTVSQSGLAIAEYSLDLDIPDHVFEHPIVKAMSNATSDMMAWANVRRLTVSDSGVTCTTKSFLLGPLFLQCM